MIKLNYVERVSDRISVILNSDLKIRVTNVEKITGNSDLLFIKHVEAFMPCMDEIRGLSIDRRKAIKVVIENIDNSISTQDVTSCLDKPASEMAVDYIDNVVRSYNDLAIESTLKQVDNINKEIKDFLISIGDVPLISKEFDVQTCTDRLTSVVDVERFMTLCDVISYCSINNDIVLFLFQKPVLMIFGIKTFMLMHKSYFKTDFRRVLDPIKERCIKCMNIYNERYRVYRNRVFIGSAFTVTSIFTGVVATIMFKYGAKVEGRDYSKIVQELVKLNEKCVPTGVLKIVLDEVEKSVAQTAFSIGTVLKAAGTGFYYVTIKPFVEIYTKK
jgi:hypothetical protein